MAAITLYVTGRAYHIKQVVIILLKLLTSDNERPNCTIISIDVGSKASVDPGIHKLYTLRQQSIFTQLSLLKIQYITCVKFYVVFYCICLVLCYSSGKE